MSVELKKLTKAELIKRAAKRKISVAPSMGKDEIVSALKKAEGKPAQASGKASKNKTVAPAKLVSVKRPVAVAKPVAAKNPVVAAKPVAKKAVATAKPATAKKPVVAAKPLAKKAVASAKPLSAKKPVAAVKPAAKKAVVTAKPVTAKKPVAAEPAAKRAVAPAKPVTVTKPAVTAKPVATPIVKATETKAKPVRGEAVKEAKEEQTTTRKSPATESKAVDAGVKDKTGKRSAGRPPASPTPPLNAGKEPSFSSAVSPLSVKTIAASNGKRSWDIKIDEKKFFIADEKYDYTQHVDQPRLPERYGDMRLIALARDPFKLYIYWELDGGGVEVSRAKLGCDWPMLSWVMRVFDVTGVEFNGANANRHFDVDVDPYMGSVYMDVDKADCEYTLVMGLRDKDGRFEPVVASNKVRTPRVEPSTQTDVEWSLPEGLFAAIYGISGGYASTTSGSLDSSKLGMPLGGVSSWGISSFESVSSGAVSSFSVSSFGASEQMAQSKQRKFFFWLDCELIVYGGTEPDATVHMMGKKIDLRPDGTFTARFSLPDGVYDIPVTAKSSDGVELREISPTATRVTRRKEEFLVSEEEWLKK